MAAVTTTPPGSDALEAKRDQLVRTRRRATALLGLVTALFLVLTVAGGDSTGMGYAVATAEAAMVGGLADWFAVVALFRHPLGLPIPHTAVVVARKDQFGETLGQFIQTSFMTSEAVMERLRGAGVGDRVAAYLCDREKADRVAGHVLGGLVTVADLLRDDDVHDALERVARERIDRMSLAPTAGRLLETLTADGRADPLVDAVLVGLDRYLDEHAAELHARFEESAPWWLPGAVEDRVFNRLLDGARLVLADMVRDHTHDLRQELDRRVASLAHDLQHDDRLRERGEELKADLLSQPELRTFVARVWSEVKETVRAQSSDPDSALRERLTETLVGLGERLRDEPALRMLLEMGLQRVVVYVIEHYGDEITGLVAGTISRWDGEETAQRLELLLGPDLQFIRINGTVVGGLAGLVIHAVAEALG